MKGDVLLVVSLPLVAGTILGASFVWWSVSWMAEGYYQVSSLIRSVKE